MAVEARHLNLFPPQLIADRDLMNSNQGNAFGHNIQMGSGVGLPTSLPETALPFRQSLLCDSLQGKTSVNTDSGLTYNITAPRKRSRDSFDQLNTPIVNFSATQKQSSISQFPSFLGDDILPLLQQYQLDIDRIVSHHTKRIKMELEERQKQQTRALVAAIGEGVAKKLKEKDEEILRMGKLNLALQERVKSLYVENQLWRDLAQTNEATANSLRSNLEQVLAHVSDERLSAGGLGGAVEEDVESCCGSSNDDGKEEEEVADGRTLAREAHDDTNRNIIINNSGRICKKCGVRESCVLLLPCRHLCLCTICGSTLLQTCPVCNSNMNATVHVNMSS